MAVVTMIKFSCYSDAKRALFSNLDIRILDSPSSSSITNNDPEHSFQGMYPYLGSIALI